MIIDQDLNQNINNLFTTDMYRYEKTLISNPILQGLFNYVFLVGDFPSLNPTNIDEGTIDAGSAGAIAAAVSFYELNAMFF